MKILGGGYHACISVGSCYFWLLVEFELILAWVGRFHFQILEDGHWGAAQWFEAVLLYIL
jgi:hypothetical protein